MSIEGEIAEEHEAKEWIRAFTEALKAIGSDVAAPSWAGEVYRALSELVEEATVRARARRSR